MRGKALVVMLCVSLGACYWASNKRGRGTNYDPNKPVLVDGADRRR